MNPEHVAIVKKGKEAIRDWQGNRRYKPLGPLGLNKLQTLDLSGADLCGAKLTDADLSGVVLCNVGHGRGRGARPAHVVARPEVLRRACMKHRWSVVFPHRPAYFEIGSAIVSNRV